MRTTSTMWRGRLAAAVVTGGLLIGALGAVAGGASATVPPEPTSTTTTSVESTTTTTTTTTVPTTVPSTDPAATGDPTTGATTLPPGAGGVPGDPQPPSREDNSGDLPVNGAGTPSRGPSEQVTPTLPPPTTTTTIPPEMVLPANSGDGRRVVYSNSLMRVWAVESDGTVVKTHRVSGKRYVPNPGTYYVFSRSLYTYSRAHPNITWMYMVRFAHSASGDNIGFHEIPTECVNGVCWKLQTEAQLGQPLSGGCVRQSTADAIWMWNWAYLGTKVVVLP